MDDEGSFENIVQVTAREDVSQILQELYWKVQQSRSGMEVDDTDNSVGALDEEGEIMSLVCDFVVEAANSYTESKLTAIRNYRNSLCPINRLPSHILSLIFVFAKWAEGRPWKPIELTLPFTLMQVSKSWREVASDTPPIWTKVDIMTRPYLSLLLAHSAHAPLEIELAPLEDAGFYRSNSEGYVCRQRCDKLYPKYIKDVAMFLSPLLPYQARWRSLEIHGVARAELEEQFVSPAPELEVLILKHQNAQRRDGGAAEGAPLGAARDLFAGQIPRLVRLTLHGIYQSLESSVYSGLLTLDLRDIAFPPGSLQELMHHLGQCPHLEYLSLTRLDLTLPGHPFEPPGPFSAVPLTFPHLRRMALHFLGSQAMQYIFVSCRFPPSVEFSIRHDDDTRGFSGIFPPNVDPTICLPGLLAPTLAISAETSIASVRCDFEPLHGSDTNPGSDLASSLHDHASYIEFLPTENVSTYMDDFLRQLSQAWSLQHLQKLCIGCSHYMLEDEEPYIILLSDLPALISLELTCAPPLVPEALILGSGPSLCPSLQELSLKYSQISRENLIELAASRAGPSDEANDGTHLRVLRLEGICDIPYTEDIFNSTLKILQDLSIDVKWDPTENEMEIVAFRKDEAEEEPMSSPPSPAPE